MLRCTNCDGGRTRNPPASLRLNTTRGSRERRRMFQPAPLHGPMDDHRFTVFNEVILGISVYTLSCIAIALTKIPGGVALFWPSTAVAGAVLIRMPRVRWP